MVTVVTGRAEHSPRQPHPLLKLHVIVSRKGSALINYTDLILNAAEKADSLEELSRLATQILADGPIFHADGSVSLTRRQVFMQGAIRIEVRPDEHPPPHFHAVGPNINAAFSIRDGSHLRGSAGRTEKKLVQICYKGGRDTLIRAWNDSRPSDCPVGPYNGD